MYANFADRLKVEHDDLAERLLKLQGFLDKPSLFNALDPVQQRLLQEQEGYMSSYLNVLQRRIALL